jgi:hypothetical protein
VEIVSRVQGNELKEQKEIDVGTQTQLAAVYVTEMQILKNLF